MDQEKKVIYLGSDKNFYKNISEVFLKDSLLKSFELEHISFSQKNNLRKNLKNIYTQKISAIIWDLAQVDVKTLNYIFILRKSINFKKVPLIARIKDKNFLITAKFLLPYGINFFCLEDSELSFIPFIKYHFSDNEFELEETALPFKKSFHHKAHSFARITSTTEHNFIAETDLIPEGRELIKTNLNLFNSGKTEVEIYEANVSIPASYYISTIGLRIPIENKEISSPSAALPLTKNFTNWVEKNATNIIKNNMKILIVDDRNPFEIDTDYLKLMKLANIRIINYFDIELNMLKNFSPNLVIFQVNDGPVNINFDKSKYLKNTMETLNFIFQKKEIFEEDKIVFSVFNCPSSSLATQKVFHYDNLLADSNNFYYDFLSGIIETYLETPLKKIPNNEFFLGLHSEKSVIQFSLDIEITSLSENFISFYFEGNLALYSILEINFHGPIYIIILGSHNKIKDTEDKKHYLAQFHGINQKDKEFLEKLSNYIKNKIEETSSENFHFTLEKELEQIKTFTKSKHSRNKVKVEKRKLLTDSKL